MSDNITEEVAAAGSEAASSRCPQISELIRHIAEQVSEMKRTRADNFSRLKASSEASRNALRKVSDDIITADLRSEQAIKCLYHMVPCADIFQSNLSEMVSRVERLEDKVCTQAEKISGICERTAILTHKFADLKHKLREQQSVEHRRPGIRNLNNPPYNASFETRNTSFPLVRPNARHMSGRSTVRATTTIASAAAASARQSTPNRRVSHRVRKPSVLAMRSRDSTLHEKDTLRRDSIFARETTDDMDDGEQGCKAKISTTEDSNGRDPDYEPPSPAAAASNNLNAIEVITIESSDSSNDREEDTRAAKKAKTISASRQSQRMAPPRRHPARAVFPRVHVTKPRPPSPSHANKRPFYYPQPYRVPPKRKIPLQNQETIIEEID